MGNNFFKRGDRDVQFVLKEHLDVRRVLKFMKYSMFSMEDFDMILEQAKKIAANELAPTFQDTDREDPAVFSSGRVSAPKCFHRIWNIFREGGWFALTQNPEFSGQGLPLIIAEAAAEFLMSANFSFGTYAGLGPAQGTAIELFGTEKLKELFVEKLYRGEWAGTMNLTEPAVGSDAHMISTRAVKDGEYYKITGSKIFITAGDHDLTENIIHMVLARVEGAPEGAKGVSLFVVPKIWVNDDGSLGEPNDVSVVGIEHKMGLHGSATCQMSYGDNGRCRGHLIGLEGLGLMYMFMMVNVARMAVGLESAAFASNIYANVLDYARTRIQGAKFGDKTGTRVRIIEHPEIRRLLMNIKSLEEGMRALTYKGYMFEDISHSSDDEQERQLAGDSLDLFTPVIKGYCSERIWEIAAMGIQILGGYGFTSEFPVEQYARDCKILSIWDGTTYIQSADLVGRKLRLNDGRAFNAWIEEIKEFIKKNETDKELTSDIRLLAEGIEVLLSMAERYKNVYKTGKRDLIPLTSTRFLDCFGEVAISHLLLEQAVICRDKLNRISRDHIDFNFYSGKIETAKFFVRNFLPNIFSRAKIFAIEDMTAVDMPEEYL